MSIGDFIKKRRKALGLSADDLAVKIGKIGRLYTGTKVVI